MEKILVILLALLFFGIGWRFLHGGHPSLIKGVVAVLVGVVIIVLASRKDPAR